MVEERSKCVGGVQTIQNVREESLPGVTGRIIQTVDLDIFQKDNSVSKVDMRSCPR